jgi:hypothetical protein
MTSKAPELEIDEKSASSFIKWFNALPAVRSLRACFKDKFDHHDVHVKVVKFYAVDISGWVHAMCVAPA